MKLFISQPRYIPALNYLNRLNKADVFVLLDTVQRQPRGWENRNKLLVNGSEKWLTIPIESSSRDLIIDTVVSGKNWIDKHKEIVISYYNNHKYFDKNIVNEYYKFIDNTISKNGNLFFTDIIISSFQLFNELFNFNTKIIKASDLNSNRKDWLKGPEELVRIAKRCKTDYYISGPNGKEYGVSDEFEGSGIKVKFHQYQHPEYQQMGTAKFIPFLGFFDAMFSMKPSDFQEAIYKELILED